MLCTLASGDESTLQYPLPDYIFGFHAQQSCEKFFKALLTAHNYAYPFTHRLEELAKLLATFQESLPISPQLVKNLEPFAVKLRYDHSVGLSPEEKAAIRESIATLHAHIVARILAIEATP